MKKILFITGTRADYGKIKSLIQGIEASKDMEAYVFVSGMHLLETYGSTYREVLKDGYKNVYVAYGLINSGNMSYDLGDVVCQLTGYVQNIRPDTVSYTHLDVYKRQTLDHKYAIAEDFDNVYKYLQERLTEANMKKDKEILEEILTHLRTMRDTWKEVMRLNKLARAN